MPLGRSIFVSQQGYLTLRIHSVYATERNFSTFVREAIGKSVGRVGEVDVSVTLASAVVRTVQSIPCVAICNRQFSTIGRQHANAAVSMLAHVEVPVSIEEQPIAPGLQAVVRYARVSRWGHERRN